MESLLINGKDGVELQINSNHQNSHKEILITLTNIDGYISNQSNNKQRL